MLSKFVNTALLLLYFNFHHCLILVKKSSANFGSHMYVTRFVSWTWREENEIPYYKMNLQNMCVAVHCIRTIMMICTGLWVNDSFASLNWLMYLYMCSFQMYLIFLFDCKLTCSYIIPVQLCQRETLYMYIHHLFDFVHFPSAYWNVMI